jgi:hypothetical protein
MAWAGDFLATSFKVELLEGDHDFNVAGDTFNIALYDNTPTFTAATTDYVTGGELANGNGYTTKGQALTNIDPTTSGTTAYCDFADEVFSTATFTAYGALILNLTSVSTTDVVCGLDFGGAQTATAGDFTIQFPAANASNAIIRIA